MMGIIQDLISFFEKEHELLRISEDDFKSDLAYQQGCWIERIIDNLKNDETSSAFNELERLEECFSCILVNGRLIEAEARNSYSLRLKEVRRLRELKN